MHGFMQFLKDAKDKVNNWKAVFYNVLKVYHCLLFECCLIVLQLSVGIQLRSNSRKKNIPHFVNDKNRIKFTYNSI